MQLPSVNNREEWLEWRRQGLGSSDVPVIMNASEYRTAFELFQEKTGRVVRPEETNFAIDRGNTLEPIARSKFCAWYNLTHAPVEEECFEPILYQMVDHPFMRTSLDGQSRDKKINVEIKYLGKKAFELACRGIVSPAHVIQIQHQLLVSGATSCFYVPINDAQTITSFQIYPDAAAQRLIFDRCVEFWNLVKANRWPTESDDDAVIADFNLWSTLGQRIKELLEQRAAVTARIFESNVEHCAGYTVRTQQRKGTIDYKRVPELKDVDLEVYRGETNEFKVITRDKT